MRTVALFGVACVVVGLLMGCSPSSPVPRFTPMETPAPRFGSDAEALDAATEAYRAYIAVSDEISQDGGEGAERILPYVTEEAAASELASFELMKESGRRTVNNSRFFGVELQQVVQTPERVEVTFWVCDDIADVRLLDESDQDITAPENSEIWLYEVAAEALPGDDRLKIISALSRKGQECER